MITLGFVVVIVVMYFGFQLIDILVCRVVSLRNCVVLWVKVMALHDLWPNEVHFEGCLCGRRMMVKLGKSMSCLCLKDVTLM
jgi:hypothetical protein